MVALLAEGVDRNKKIEVTETATAGVALLAEGVDRNIDTVLPVPAAQVALLAEGVDRNFSGNQPR